MSMNVNCHINRENDIQFAVTHHEHDRGDFFTLDMGQQPVPTELCIFVNREQLQELARVVNAALKANPAPVDAEAEARYAALEAAGILTY